MGNKLNLTSHDKDIGHIRVLHISTFNIRLCFRELIYSMKRFTGWSKYYATMNLRTMERIWHAIILVHLVSITDTTHLPYATCP